MRNKYFGTDGIRGTVNKGNITGEKFFKFGLASGTYFKNQKKSKQIAIIAKDTRLSGYTLEPALVSGLVSGGMHVFTLGHLPTNGLAMFRKSLVTEFHLLYCTMAKRKAFISCYPHKCSLLLLRRHRSHSREIGGLGGRSFSVLSVMHVSCFSAFDSDLLSNRQFMFTNFDCTAKT